MKHKVLEIAFKIVDVLSGNVVDAYQATLAISPADWSQSDPQSLKINGFSWQDIKTRGVPVEQVCKEIIECFAKNQIKRGSAVFICQNPSFDRAFFAQIVDPDMQEKAFWPYHWLDLASMFWVIGIKHKQHNTKLWPWEIGLSKDKIAAAFCLPSEIKPHRAMNGVDHLILCYQAVATFPFAKS